MIRENSVRLWALLGLTTLGMALMPQPARAAGYVQRNLASDVPGLADFTDPNMTNPWGIAGSPNWICNNRTGTYNRQGTDGAPTTSVTIVPTAPGKTGKGTCTGAAHNNNTAAFQVSPGVSGEWLLDTEDGLITVRSGAQNIIKVDNSAAGAVYKGLAIKNSSPDSPGDYIYAANFNSGKIDVYDGNWTAATLAGNFTDPEVPDGFAPFNIQNLGGKLYVAYAKQDAAKHDDVSGAGNGYVAVFDTNGNLLQHLISNGPLNSPWGFAITPANWGDFSNALLVGNFGGGLTNAYDLSTGRFLGPIADPAGRPLVNTGLWALQFGIGGSGGDPTKLYLTAGISAGAGKQNHGLFASISVASVVGAPPGVNVSGIVNNASFAPGSNALAPGSIAALFGTDLTDGTSCLPPTCNPTFDNGTPRRLRGLMAGAQVTINNALIPVPIFYASPTQLGIQIPTDLTGTSATVQVTVNGQPSTTRTITIDAFSPGIFTFTSDGRGPGAITHTDGTPVNATSPARPGEVVILYATGLGQVTPAVLTGALPSGTVTTVTRPTVTIDGIAADVQFAGLSGCCVGLNQINVVVPSNARIANDVSVVLSIGGQTANTVTLATAAQASSPLTLTFSASVSAQVGALYSVALVASGGVPPYTFSVASGSLPPGLTLDASSGSITGTPTTAGAFSAVAQVTDSSGGKALAATTDLSISVAATPPPPPPITLSSLTLNPTSVTGGSSSQGTVVLSAAPSSDTAVSLSSSNPTVVSVPASVTVPAGSTRATFTITTRSVATSTPVTITASAGGVIQTATLTVIPAPPPPPPPYGY